MPRNENAPAESRSSPDFVVATPSSKGWKNPRQPIHLRSGANCNVARQDVKKRQLSGKPTEAAAFLFGSIGDLEATDEP